MSPSSPLHHLRSVLFFLLLTLILSSSLFLASAQSSGSSSSALLPTAVSAAASSSAGSAAGSTAAAGTTLSPTSTLSAAIFSSSSPSNASFFSSSSGPSAYSSPCVNISLSTTNSSVYYEALCPSCYVNYTNVSLGNGNFTLNSSTICVNVTLYCTATLINTTTTPTTNSSTPNPPTYSTTCVNYTTPIVVPIVIPTTAQILANASCPVTNPLEIGLVYIYNASQQCAGGEADGRFTCDYTNLPPGVSCPSGVAQGKEQDSLYSTNPPYWWRCTYTAPSTLNTTCNNAAIAANTSNVNCTIPGAVTSGLTVVDPNCFTDSSVCAPRRYMTTLNNLQPDGSQQWPGQTLPPYSQFNVFPLAIVTAGAAQVEASIFYPYLDELQLLQLINSYNASFLSLSASTRIVVEFIGGVISNSRTRINATCAYVVPFFTLIVDLDQGYIDSASWQDDCSTCTPEAFVYSDDGACNCGVPIGSCIGFNASSKSSAVTTAGTNFTATSVSCDLQIYIAFSGTDSGGAVLTSSSRTIANFRKWSFASVYDSALGFYDNLPNLANNFNSCQTYNSDGTCAT